MGYVLIMSPLDIDSIHGLYRKALPSGFLRRLGRQFGLRRGIYSLGVVVWLMMRQRLQTNGSLAQTVRELRSPAGRKLLPACKRVRDGRISAGTGGYCQARQNLPIEAVNLMADEIFEHLRAQLRPGCPGLDQPVFLLDGSSIRLAAQGDLPEHYPPVANQHGSSHWPVLKIAVLHDAVTGLAMRPRWGPMNGPKACSEQQLAVQAMEPLPAGAVLLGDRNFGIFGMAWKAQQRGHPVVLRLTAQRAKKLLGRALQPGLEEEVVWRPSQWDRRTHPDLPADAAVSGRLLICTCPGAREPLLCLFTTLLLPAAEVAQLYGLRWNVETDLRSLKHVLRLHQWSCRSAAMMEKELVLAMAAYNLVRAVMWLAAERAGVPPRRLSFSAVYGAIECFLPYLLAAKTKKTRDRYFEQMVALAAEYKLPRRRKKRCYPREVWGSGSRFPTRKGCHGKIEN